MQGKTGLWHNIKKQFVLGLVIILPLAATIYVMWFLFTRIDNILGRYMPQLFGVYLRGVGFVTLLLVIWLAGFVGQSRIGRTLIHYVRAAVLRTPIFGHVFKGFDEVGAKIISPRKKTFETVVIVEYPKKDSYALGFMTSEDVIKFKTKKIELMPVFVPTTPNPTSGFLLLFPKNKIHPIDISIKKGMETVISMGLVHPNEYRPKKL